MIEISRYQHRASLVIPTWNGERELQATLSAVRSVRGGAELPILIVDSHSKDRTCEVALQMNAKVVVIPPGSFNHGGTRNLGISLTESEFVILMTQDAVPADEDWLDNLLSPFADPLVAGVYARQVAPASAPARAAAEQSYVDGEHQESAIHYLNSLSEWFHLSPIERYRLARFDNVCSAIRREVWERIPFSMAPYGEDIDWGIRTLQAGYRLVYQPLCRVWHAHERPASYLYKRMVVDHQLLAERFRLLTVPSWWYVPRAVLSGILWECRNAWYSPNGSARWRRLLAAPGMGIATTLGQYIGGRRWRIGLPREAQKGV